ncbi:hypothetical protein BpHYR1_027613 [Brachionus plicatilis]|uniref:Uncharacterized protein n=1 Tax=Brachionus plicatilis TaxID=10195 RepID=A0A3M7S4A7_BRAPC|nr:hypothetical protein BpHYR1_027613 [Brachionus plicatilis]
MLDHIQIKKWGLDLNTLGNLYMSLIGSILRYDTPSNRLHHEAYNKLKLLTVSNRLFELSERYVRAGLSHSIITVRLVEEYNKDLESRYIEYPTPLSFSSGIQINK